MPKKMTKEEFNNTVRAQREIFVKGTTMLQELATLTSRSDEFTFSGLESSKRFLEQVAELNTAAKNIRDAFIRRGLTKTAEECKMFKVTKKLAKPVVPT